MLIYGFHPVREALRRRPHEVGTVLVASRRRGGRRSEIEALCRRRGIRLEVLPERRLDELVAGVHNGFAARLKRAAGPKPATADTDLVVLAEDVQDPRNLGALLRVCETAGVGRVLLRDRGSAPLGATAEKASAGAAEWVALDRVVNPAREIEKLKKDGYWVYGADPAGDPPWEIDLTGKVVLCLGGEQKGLRRRTRSLCDRLVGLPMRGRVESLNLSTAAAAILYEALRQRSA